MRNIASSTRTLDPAVAHASPRTLPRMAHVDGLRALAALYVVVHHAYLTVWPPEYHRQPASDVLVFTRQLGYGRLAVSAFIVLSGFCLTLPIVSRDAGTRFSAVRFFRRRCRRIVPTYLAALALSLALALTLIGRPSGTHWDMSLPITSDGVVAHVALLQDLHAPGQINHVLWSIALEWHIYLVFPVLVMLWRRCGPWVTTLGSAALLYAISDYIGNSSSLPIIYLPPFLLLFIFGMLAASVVASYCGRVPPAAAGGRWLTAAVAAGIAALAYLALRGEDSFYPDLLVGLTTLGLLVACSLAPVSLASRVLGWRPLVAIGAFSYSLYLIHAPLLQVIWQYALAPHHLPPSRTFALLVTVGAACILGAAHVFFLAFERPFLVRRGDPKPEASTAEARIRVTSATP